MKRCVLRSTFESFSIFQNRSSNRLFDVNRTFCTINDQIQETQKPKSHKPKPPRSRPVVPKDKKNKEVNGRNEDIKIKQPHTDCYITFLGRENFLLIYFSRTLLKRN